VGKRQITKYSTSSVIIVRIANLLVSNWMIYSLCFGVERVGELTCFKCSGW